MDTHIHPRPDCTNKEILLSYLQICREHRIRIVGFVEHGKRCNGHETILNNLEKIEQFHNACQKLQKEWKNEFQVFCGIEIDYFDNYAYTKKFLKEVQESPVDFVIGSVHGKRLEHYEEYLDATLTLIESYEIDVLGHMQFSDDYLQYQDMIEKIFWTLNKRNIVFEVNLARRYGIVKRLEQLKKFLYKYDVKITWGSDAHALEEMNVQILEQEYMRSLEI